MADKSKARSKSGKARGPSSSRATKGVKSRSSGRTKARKTASGPPANRAKRIKDMKALLLQRRADLVQGMQQKLRYQASPAPTKGDSSDLAANSLDSDTAMQLAETGSSEIAQIDEALQNIDEGTYGQCQPCGGEIPIARLEALPYATFCVRCKEEQERLGAGGVSTAGWSAVDEFEDLEQDMG